MIGIHSNIIKDFIKFQIFMKHSV